MKDMFLTDRKLDRRITEVKKYRYRNIRNLEEFAVQEDLQGVVNPQVPAEFDNWDTIHTGDCWSGRDRYLWMHKDIFLISATQEPEITPVLRLCAILTENPTRA